MRAGPKAGEQILDGVQTVVRINDLNCISPLSAVEICIHHRPVRYGKTYSWDSQDHRDQCTFQIITPNLM